MKNLLIISLLFLVSACTKARLNTATDTIEGEWTITKIIQTEGERQELGVGTTDSQEWTGDLGVFNFKGDDKVDYEWEIPSGTVNRTNRNFEIEHREIGGFTGANGFSLLLDGKSYNLVFGDGTSDAHKEATALKMYEVVTELGAFKSYDFELERR